MLSNLKIPKELRRKIENELQSGEFIRWVEQPIPRYLTFQSITAGFIGIFMTGFSFFGIWGAGWAFNYPDLREVSRSGLLGGLIIFSPLLLIGFRCYTDPFWVWHDAQNSVYFATDKRAVSIQYGWPTTIRSYLPDQLEYIYRRERADGTGDVIFLSLRQRNVEGHEYYEKIGFWGVRNPRAVENVLKQLAQNNAQQRPYTPTATS
jgi:hypothetical protein